MGALPRALLALCLCLAATLAGAGETSDDRGFAPPYPVIDSEEPASLGLFTAWHEDRAGTLDIEQAGQLPPQEFHIPEGERLHFGFSRSTFWFRVALQNTRDTDETLLLGIPVPSLALVEFYRPVGDGYAVTRSGTSTRRVIGDFDHQDYLFGVTVPAGTTEVFWFRVQSDMALDFTLTAERPESFTHDQSIAQVASGMTMGLLAALALFNLFALLATRRTVHAWYALCLAAVIAYLLARLGYVGVLFFRGPGVQAVTEAAAAGIATLGALQFARVFLGTRENLPQVDAAIVYLLYAGGIALLAGPLLEPWQYGPAYTTFAALAMPLTLFAAILAARRGCPDARRYIVARLLSGGFGALALGSDVGLIDLPVSAVELLIAGATLESAMLLLALYLRDGRIRRERRAAQMQRAVAEAESRARNDFLTQFSHDVRTPLNGILGMTELLADTTLTPRQREYVGTVRASGETLLLLVNEAVDWSRLEAGQLELQIADFDLAELLAESIAAVRTTAEEKHLELVVDIDHALSPRLQGDVARIRQVLCNLLANAVRYTNRGDVHLSARATATPGEVLFEVRDTGVGIPRERLAGLFDGHGRGLGLVVARRLAERMGGTITAESEELHGSTFRLRLPLAAATAPVAAIDTALLDGKRLLVVDDNDAVRRVIETQAAGWGMVATGAGNGQQALALARTQANLGLPYDVVIVDHNMPGMSGLQLAARIKEDPLIRHDAVIVMLTGLNIAPTETMARNVGIRRVLTKPVSGRTLQAVLAEEIARRERFEPDPGGTTATGALPDNLRVLVVEDNHLSQKVIRGMLGKLGVRSDVVSNGQEAVEAVQHHAYDLVLMDCEMPVLDGYDATRRIRAWEADNHRRRMPVIALSAHILQEIKERCRQAGMDGHMAKPVDLNELRETLRSCAPRQ